MRKNKDRVIAIIPARKDSRSIVNKNIKDFAGRPLIYWVTKAANEADITERVIVSTDSARIRKTVEGFKFKKVKVVGRSRRSAVCYSPSETALIEVAKKWTFRNLVFLQATNPFIKSSDIDSAYKLYKEKRYDSLLSCVPQKRFIWKKEGSIASCVNYDYRNRPRRQDFKGFFVENGALYITSKENLLKYKNRLSNKIGIYPLPLYSYFELDEPDDWEIAEAIFLRSRLHLKRRLNLKKIRLLVLDVDGVLTDGGVYYSRDGERMLKFSRIDGKGIELFLQEGKIAVISSEDSWIAKRRLEKLNIKDSFLGISDKWRELKKYLRKNNISLEETAFMGDDIQDLEVIKKVGFSACPYNAVEAVKNRVDYISNKRGGQGAVRELIDLILERKRK